MNASTNNDVAFVFDARYAAYVSMGNNWSDFTGMITDLFQKFVSICFDNGSVELGRCGDEEKVEYLLITSKVGKFLMYREFDGTVRYICEERFSICQTAREAGFGETSGVIDTVKKINHIFAIPDSYL